MATTFSAGGKQYLYDEATGNVRQAGGANLGPLSQLQANASKVPAWRQIVNALSAAQQGRTPAASASPLPGLGTIGKSLTPQQFQSIADQLRTGAQSVRVGGKQYQIAPSWAAQIKAGYPAAQRAQQAPETRTEQAVGTTTGGAQPESVALQQMAEIDPASEALRQQLAKSYAEPLSQAQGPPSAGTLQSYLDLYKQLDPTSLAATQQLGAHLQAQEALGPYLDPQAQREVAQGTRAAQGARGNVYGTSQMVEEAMARGQAGMATQRQRQQDLQSYLSAGLSPATTAVNLYQQNLANLRAAQSGAQSYLGSGVTPYQAGAGYLGAAQQAGAAASQGGPQYQPAALSSPYSYMSPTYGQNMGAQANQWYNSLLSNYGMQAAQGGGARSRLMGAAGGALGGAVAGSALGPWGTLGGAVVGGLGGALSS
jgi:hypothetical protein